jgi:hypothetical protein
MILELFRGLAELGMATGWPLEEDMIEIGICATFYMGSVKGGVTGAIACSDWVNGCMSSCDRRIARGVHIDFLPNSGETQNLG